MPRYEEEITESDLKKALDKVSIMSGDKTEEEVEAENRAERMARSNFEPFRFGKKGSFKRRWLAYEFLGYKKRFMIAGETNIGKSFLALDMALSFAGGQDDFCGFPIEEPCKVVYVCAEDSDEVEIRAEAWRIKRNPSAEQQERIESNFIKLKTDGFAVLDRSEDGNNSPKFTALCEDIEFQLQASGWTKESGQPVLIIFDTLRQTTNGSETSDTDMNNRKRLQLQLVARFNASVGDVHHTKKYEADTYSGSGVLASDIDNVFSFSRSNPNDTESQLVLKCGKAKNSGTGWVRYFHKSEPITIDVDDKGRPITSIVLEQDKEEKRAEAEAEEMSQAESDGKKLKGYIMAWHYEATDLKWFGKTELMTVITRKKDSNVQYHYTDESKGKPFRFDGELLEVSVESGKRKRLERAIEWLVNQEFLTMRTDPNDKDKKKQRKQYKIGKSKADRERLLKEWKTIPQSMYEELQKKAESEAVLMK